ncbi:ribonuclease HII [[Eubacterium] cellulosolvens]
MWTRLGESQTFGFPKGPIIGPLVIAGLTINENKVHQLSNLGIKDSKLHTRKAREILAPQIISLTKEHVLFEIEPQEIDSIVMRGKPLRRLNQLEVKFVAKILDKLKPDIVYVDAPDRSPERFACQIIQKVCLPIKIISEHKADQKYPIVSAASILAKQKRDEIIENLHEIYGDFGSGYPSDPKTIKFLKKWIKRDGCNLHIVRRTWKTFKNLESEL